MGHDRRIKTEAHGKSRWCRRAIAKKDSNVKRRHIDKREANTLGSSGPYYEEGPLTENQEVTDVH